jgi:hypothetical protein
MKVIKQYLLILFTIISGYAIAQPANDDCSTAQNIGTLPAAPACPGAGTGAQLNIAGTIVGATAPNPYLSQLLVVEQEDRIWVSLQMSLVFICC